MQGDPGSIQLARALKEHTNEKLVDLDIGYNEIKDDGACALAGVHIQCSTPFLQLPASRPGLSCLLGREAGSWMCLVCAFTGLQCSSMACCSRAKVLMLLDVSIATSTISALASQALKANPQGAPKELKISSNRLTRFGQVALQEALDMVFEMTRNQKEITIVF